MTAQDAKKLQLVSAEASVDTLRASVIIPHLNTPELLVKCLQAVSAQRLDVGGFEIIVVDNGSKIPLTALQAAWPEVQFLVQPEPGPGPARNLGVAHSKGRTLAFVDADIRVAPDWLQKGIDAVERDPSKPYGGDVRIDFHNPRQINGIEAFEAVFSFRQKMYIQKHGFSGTGNLMVDRDLWHKVGPFVGIGSAEDRDWGHRARAIGASAQYLPDMVVFHPARQNFAEITSRWSRIIAHDFTKHYASGKPILLWNLRAYAVLASALAHTPMLMLSSRVPTVRGRLKGLTILFKTRWFRFQKMRSITKESHLDSAMQWNRPA